MFADDQYTDSSIPSQLDHDPKPEFDTPRKAILTPQGSLTDEMRRGITEVTRLAAAELAALVESRLPAAATLTEAEQAALLFDAQERLITAFLLELTQLYAARRKRAPRASEFTEHSQ